MIDETSAGRVTLVTGTASGIGKSIAETLLDDGWQVIGLDKEESDISHPAYRGILVDLLSGEELIKAVAALGQVKAFVHAAGFMKVGNLGELDPADGLQMWRIHVGAATLIANAIVDGMAAGGRIVLIGSRVAGGAAGKSQYAAVKSALVGLARSWAIELAPRGITVNVVAPAATDTGMLTDPKRQSVAPKLPPIGRFLRPQEIAGYVRFLLSEEAGAITGQNLLICGGSSL